MSKPGNLAKRYRLTSGKGFRLSDWDPGDTAGLEDKDVAERALRKGVERLAELQDRLYADGRWSVLLIFQAMDAAGKDGTIKHVLSGVNPQGCQVFSFKAPSSEELAHDFLWRTTRCLPERGRIGVFNRSYYEETLIVRVHPDMLARQRLAPELTSKGLWDGRFASINDFEEHLARNGTVVRKFFLNVSKEEQKRRFLKRLDDTDRNWKFSTGDAVERGHWDAYQEAYQDTLRATASKHAPWYVVPADHKWFSRMVVAEAVIEALESVKPAYPTVSATKRSELARARALLDAEGKAKRVR